MIFFKHCYPISGTKWCILIGGKPISLKITKTLNFAILITFITCFKVSAILNAQQVNLTLKNAPLETAFNEIKKQTGYSFWYDKEDLNNAAKISINVKNAGLKETLDQCFKNQPYTYEIFDKTIVVKRKAKNNSGQINNKNINLNIRGKVTDGQDSPMSGVSVKLIGTNKVTITDKDGQFSIDVPDENAVLQFTYLGFASIEHKVKKDRFLNIILKEELNTLQSVEINAGYYTVKERERTGSISRVDAKTIEKQPISNPLMALQNRVPGLEITQQTGVPGGGFTVQIRGRNSITSGTDPLYIIDGVTFPSTKISANSSATIYIGANPLSTIDANDIQSIEVLKDADATAIYGSRGANGVILITTKRSKNGESNISASVMQGINEVASKIEMLNTQQYLDMRREAFKNDGLAPGATDYDINGTWEQNKYTDWQDYFIGSKGSTTNASVSVSGGNENSNYLLGGNYYREGTVFVGNSTYQRAGMHTSINFGSPKSRLTAQFTGSYNHIQSNLLRTDLTYLITLAPNFPDLYDEYGKLNWANNTIVNNPISELLRTNESGTDTFVANVSIRYRILNNLFFSTSAGYTMIKRIEYVNFPTSTLSPANPSYNSPTARNADFSDNFNNNLLVEPQLNYTGNIGRGKLEALAGMSIQENNSQFRTIRGAGFSSDELMDNLASAATLTINELKYTQYRYIAGFGRINYSFANKYFLNITGRRDGSTRFGPDKQFAYFGAVGAAWIFSEEKLFKDNIPYLSFGKLRASIGLTGNDQITDYQYLQLWNNSAGTYQGNATLTPTRIANPDYAWEINRKSEVALQLGFLNDRIRFETAYYRNISSNQLVGMALPLSVAYPNIQSNLPAKVQNTGLEFDLNWRIIEQKEIGWTVGLNLTIPKNKLINYPGLETSSNSSNFIIGEPLTIRKIYNTTINQNTGIYQFEDYDGNGTINSRDRFLYKFIGQYYYGAINNSIRFKQFTVDFLVSFNKQNGNNYMANIANTPGRWVANSPLVNQPVVVLDKWKNPNDVTKIQRFTTITSNSTLYTMAKGDGGLSIQDASFMRLKNISLSYNLPKQWLQLLGLKNAQLLFQGQNIFTFTKYVGLDPESQSMSNLPPLRSLVAGIRINL
jgi:TonB-linked SusC/RagA family outer membrane protein